MPAGSQDSEYGSRLNSIDWLKLYKEHDGYLMFEDLKLQWRSAFGFDYVLIDSRTGHTDIGGICTRQLPDATVLMFLPNDQNIMGLQTIASHIRSEAGEPREKRIHIHFCPSNVPDLDDEELILQRHLEDAKERLQYDEPASIIHHYNSLALLDQVVFSKERPKTKLADEYRRLVDAIVSENLEDKQGSLSKLKKIQARLRSMRPVEGLDVDNILAEIFRLHPDDGEVAWSAAQVYSMIGDLEAERTSLDVAIRHRVNEIQARTRRALIVARDSKSKLAREDLRAIILSPSARVLELASSIYSLRELDEDWLQTVARSPAIRKLKGDELRRIVYALLFDRAGARLAVRLMGAGEMQTSRTEFALALIACGEYSAAKLILGPKADVLASGGIRDVFNYACAEWGETGAAPTELFSRVRFLATKSEEEDNNPNFQQCLAIASYAVGDYEAAKKFLVQARTWIEMTPGSVFSCWRYLMANREDFIADLQEMRQQMEQKGELLPRYRAAAASVH